ADPTHRETLRFDCEAVFDQRLVYDEGLAREESRCGKTLRRRRLRGAAMGERKPRRFDGDPREVREIRSRSRARDATVRLCDLVRSASHPAGARCRYEV